MNTVKFINQILAESSLDDDNRQKQSFLDEIRSKLYQLYIKTSYDNTGRMILFPGQRGANVIGKINSESNGLLVYVNAFDKRSLDDTTYDKQRLEEKLEVKLLGVPMPYARNSNQVRADALVKSWKPDTKVYQRENGTHVVIYYFENKWTIATAKGIDMNETIWRTKTYQEMLNDCLAPTGWEEFTQALNPAYSYAACFNHEDLHVFSPTIYGSKFIIENMVRLSDGVDISQTHEPDFVKMLEKTRLKSVTSDPITFDIKSPELIIDTIKTNCFNAHLDYEEADIVQYGYVVRGLDGGDVVFESSLQKLLNELYYDQSYTQDITDTSYERHKYVLLFNYLSENSEMFIELFPQFKSDFNNFSANMRDIVEQLKTMYQNAKQKAEQKKEQTPKIKIIDEIKQNIDQLTALNVDNKYFESRVHQLLYAPVNFDALYRYIFH